MTTDKKFACAINCMDGRVQDAVKNYMQKNDGVDYVDKHIDEKVDDNQKLNFDECIGYDKQMNDYCIYNIVNDLASIPRPRGRESNCGPERGIMTTK